MKTFRKSGSTALAVLLISSAFAFTTKSSPVKRTQSLYGRLSTGEWVNIDSNPDRQCNASQNVCKAYFDSQPAMNATPASQDIVENNGTLQ